MPDFTLKWTENHPSDVVLLSFEHRWIVPIQQRQFSVVYRRAWPKKRDPKEMFMYVGAPLCQIVARARIEKSRAEPLDDALKVADAALLTEQELRAYVGDRPTVNVIDIGPIHLATRPISLSVLSEEYGYFPSPAATALSSEGVSVLSTLAKFE